MTRKDIRQLIHDRDDMEKTAPGTVATVELSHSIRQALRNVRTDAAQLDKLQKDEKAHYIKKNKQDEEREQQIEHRYILTSPLHFIVVFLNLSSQNTT